MSNPEQRFERFTKRARKVLTLAQQEAQRINHNYIGTEHLLLGLIREEEGVAAQVLNNLGVELQKVRPAVESIVGRGDHELMGEIGLTPRAKKVIELAVDEARLLNHRYVGTEHLLLGLVREGEGIAVGVLESLGVSLEKVRQEVIQVLNQSNYAAKATLSELQRQPDPAPVSLLLGQNLTEQAQQAKLDPVIGREAETARLIQVLSRRTKGNPILLGEPGVGKTALVEGLAQQMAKNEVPPNLRKRSLLSLDTGLLAARAVAYSKNSGTMTDYLERFEQTLAEVRRTKAILFVDEIHLLGAAVAEGGESLINVLKLAIARGDFQVIGATTPAEYHKFIETDEIAGRFLQPVLLVEPDIAQTIAMLQGLRSRYEEFHQVQISDEAVTAAAQLSSRYPSSRYRPDRAIDLLDEAAVMVHSRHTSQPSGPKQALTELRQLHKRKFEAVAAQDWDLAKELSLQETQLRATLSQAIEAQAKARAATPVVTKADIVEVVAMLTDTPIDQIEV